MAGIPVRLYGPVKLGILHARDTSLLPNRGAGLHIVGEAMTSTL